MRCRGVCIERYVVLDPRVSFMTNPTAKRRKYLVCPVAHAQAWIYYVLLNQISIQGELVLTMD
jgi:hypothetical protein